MTAENPFVRKAKRDRARATMLRHLRDLQALLKRLDGEPGETRDRISQRVEECKREIRAMEGR